MRLMLTRLYWPQLLIGAITGLIAAGLSYAAPVFINHILNFIAMDTPTKSDQHRAYMFAGVWACCSFIGLLFDQQSQWNCVAVSMKAEQAIQMTIYTKMMKLAPEERTLFQ